MLRNAKVVLIRFVLGRPVAEYWAYTRVPCSEITRMGPRDSSRCSPLAIFCSPFSICLFSKECFNLVHVWETRTTFRGQRQARYHLSLVRGLAHREGGFGEDGFSLSLSLSPVAILIMSIHLELGLPQPPSRNHWRPGMFVR